MSFAALLGGAALALAPAGVANAHPVITYLSCESGGATYMCSLSYTGAHEPASIQWYVNGSHRTSWDGATFVRQTSCIVGNTYQVSATVTDVHGSDTASYNVYCRKVWQ